MGNGCSRADVIRCLKAHQVRVELEPVGDNLYTVSKNDFNEKICLFESVPMWIIQRFKSKMDIPIDHFQHPEKAEADNHEE